MWSLQIAPSLEKAGNCLKQDAQEQQHWTRLQVQSWTLTVRCFQVVNWTTGWQNNQQYWKTSANKDRCRQLGKSSLWVPSALWLCGGSSESKGRSRFIETLPCSWSIGVQARAEPAPFFRLTEYEISSSCNNTCSFIVLVKLVQTQEKHFKSRACGVTCRKAGCRAEHGWTLPLDLHRCLPQTPARSCSPTQKEGEAACRIKDSSRQGSPYCDGLQK